MKNPTLVSLLGLVLSLTAATTAFAQAVLTPGTWTSVTPMTTARWNSSAGVIGANLYVAGGQTTTLTQTMALEAYNATGNTWSPLAAMPGLQTGAASGVLNNLLYVVGGGDSSSIPLSYTSTVTSYNPVGDTWTTHTPTPAATARTGAGGAVINGLLYVVGGSNATVALTTLEVYDPVAETWTTKMPMSTARTGLAVGAVNGILYAIGGNDGAGTALNTVEAYDPLMDTWTTLASMPTARENLSAAVVNGILYAVGGFSNLTPTPLDTVESYDAALNAWTTGAPISSARGSLEAVSLNNTLYAVGGTPDFIGAAQTLEFYTDNLVASGTVGTAFTYQITATSANPPIDPYTATGLPTGLSVEASTGLITGTPTQAGTFSVNLSATDAASSTGTATLTLIVATGTATVTLSDLTAIYDGTAKSATVTTDPVSLAFTVTYDLSATPPTNAGSYAVVATVNDPNYTGTASGTLVISPATATVTLGDLAAIYDTTPKSATATTNPALLAVTFTYDLSPTPPTLAGSYAVVGTINDPNYTGSASDTFVIAQATATVTLGSLSATYDGTAQLATATTNPTGLAVTFTYNGSPVAPIAAGTYAVVGTVDDPNYTGTASDNLVIAQAAATVTLGNLSATYDGSPKSATAATNPINLTVAITYDGSATPPTIVGTYAVVATITDPNYSGTASGPLVIGKGTPVITWVTPAPITYPATLSGTQLNATANVPGSFVYSPDVGALLVAGAQTLNTTFTPTDTANYNGALAQRTLTVNQGVATVTLGNLSATYDGAPKAASATTNPVSLAVTFTYDLSATPPMNAGSYAVVGTVNDPNYTGTGSGTLVIAMATPVITWATPAPITYPAALSVTQLSATASVPGTFVYNPAVGAVLGAGAQPLNTTFTPTDAVNYTGATAQRTLTVNQGVATVTLSGLNATYDGSPKAATATTNPVSLAVTFTYAGSGTPPTAAGTYAVVGTVNDPNYTGTASGNLVIAKGTPVITWATPAAIIYPAALSVTQLNATADVPGLFVYNPAAGAVLAAGAPTLNATFTPTDAANYNGASAQRTLTVNQGVATVTLGNLSATYDGAPKAATATTSPVSLTVTFTYAGSPTPPTAAGTYAVVGTVTDPNYTGTGSGNLVIAKVSLTVTADDVSRVYGAANPAFTATISGFVNSETVSVVSGTPVFSGSATTAIAAGPYVITPAAGNLSAANYSFGPFVNGTLTVTKAPLTVTADDKTRVIHTANPAFTVTYGGFVLGDSASSLTTQPTATTTATLASAAGVYPITPSGGVASNYTFSYIDGTLTVLHSTVSDFNGDGNSDLLWANTVNGDHYLWLMNGGSVTASIFLGTIAPQWIATSADFNGDGDADILWSNTSNGDRYLWLMNGGSVTSSIFLGTVAPQWTATTGDFNGDGKADIVWSNTANGDRYLWLMNGGTVASSIFLGTVGIQWTAATGDFNGDGKSDLLWSNTANGDRYLWLMNGGTVASSVFLGTVGIQWTATTGDFNGDGKADIVWSNTSDGDRYLWLMNGGTVSSSVFLGTVAPVWTPTAGDFNGDGKSDLIWSNTSSGDRYLWLMNGGVVTSSIFLGTVAPVWLIVP